MRFDLLHIGHGPSEERHHVGMQSSNVVGRPAIVEILDVQVGRVVGVFLIHAAFDGESRGERDGGDEPVLRVFQRIIGEVAVQSGIP